MRPSHLELEKSLRPSTQYLHSLRHSPVASGTLLRTIPVSALGWMLLNEVSEAWPTTAELLSQLYHSARHQRTSTGADSQMHVDRTTPPLSESCRHLGRRGLLRYGGMMADGRFEWGWVGGYPGLNDYLKYWYHFLDAVHICSTSSQDVALLPGCAWPPLSQKRCV